MTGGNVTLDSSGTIGVGTTTWQGAGVQLDYGTAGRFYAGDGGIGAGNNFIQFDGTLSFRGNNGNVILTDAGALTVTSGDIGGWNIGATTITDSAGNVTLDSAGNIYVGGTTFSTTAGIQLEYNGGTPQFYVGDGNTNFLQFASNALTFQGTGNNVSLDASGNLSVGAGDIAGWTINGDAIEKIASGDGISLDSTDQALGLYDNSIRTVTIKHNASDPTLTTADASFSDTSNPEVLLISSNSYIGTSAEYTFSGTDDLAFEVEFTFDHNPTSPPTQGSYTAIVKLQFWNGAWVDISSVTQVVQ